MILEGKVAIITGSSRGIGKAIALAMAKEGADIVVAARTEVEQERMPGTISQTAQMIKQMGRRVLAIRTDISDDQQVAEMVERTVAEFGHIDIIVNNAGIGSYDSVLDISVKRWDLIMAVNLRGTFICTKMVLPYMVNQKSGHIINISSILATTIRGSVAYGVTKAGIIRFTQGLARELKKFGIAANVLCPSFTDTEGVRLLSPGVDTSGFQSPEMWGRYAALVASQDPKNFLGKVLFVEDLRQELGEV